MTEGESFVVVATLTVPESEWLGRQTKPTEVAFGPDTEKACQDFIDHDRDAQASKGGRTGLDLTIKKAADAPPQQDNRVAYRLALNDLLYSEPVAF